MWKMRNDLSGISQKIESHLESIKQIEQLSQLSASENIR